ncbi:hypothetical protein KP509_31G061700 [Ceratopteris richardii]|uniref:Uncharacterized protein n=1 Tax=Ceratopteris richardii TaxID=49495 RepID=A0A8T2QYG2_CERRI|nr:hypothetical protein KP509_31G061700 [Ceratopteris richardii]
MPEERYKGMGRCTIKNVSICISLLILTVLLVTILQQRRKFKALYGLEISDSTRPMQDKRDLGRVSSGTTKVVLKNRRSLREKMFLPGPPSGQIIWRAEAPSPSAAAANLIDQTEDAAKSDQRTFRFDGSITFEENEEQPRDEEYAYHIDYSPPRFHSPTHN